MYLGNDRGWEGMLAFLVFDNPKVEEICQNKYKNKEQEQWSVEVVLAIPNRNNCSEFLCEVKNDFFFFFFIEQVLYCSLQRKG